MNISYLLNGPILWFSFIVFFSSVLTRTTFIVLSLIKSSWKQNIQWKQFLERTIRYFFPLHKLFVKRPFYSIPRVVFHICLFAVPIGFSGHITLLEESSLELSYWAIPDDLCDQMTMLVMVFAVFFLFRRILFKKARKASKKSDFLLIFIAGITFATGYALTYGTLEDIPFFEENMWDIHLLAGEFMLISAAFLLCRPKMNIETCTGCGSCASACIADALEFKDSEATRLFKHGYHQCLCCGECIVSCSEKAMDIGHEFGLLQYFKGLSGSGIHNVMLDVCESCGTPFAPAPQIDMVKGLVEAKYPNICENCKTRNFSKKIAGII